MDAVGLESLFKKLKIQQPYKSRNWLNACCPLAPWTHKKKTDSNPSFGALIDPQGSSFYKCHSCGYAGNLIDLIMVLQKYRQENYTNLILDVISQETERSYGEYEDFYAEDIDDYIEPLCEEAYGDIYDSALKFPNAVKYLESRRISKYTAKRLDLRFDPLPEEQRVIFPVRGFKDELYGYTGRTILSPEQYPKRKKNYPKIKDYYGLQKRKLLLGADRVDVDNKEKPLLVVEGLFGWASLIEQEVDSLFDIVALMGNQMTDHKANLIINLNKPVYLMLDNDEGGDIGLFGRKNNQGKHLGGGAIDKLKEHVLVYVPEYPKNKIDPDQLTYKDMKKILSNCPIF